MCAHAFPQETRMVAHNRVPRIVIAIGLGVLGLIAIQVAFSPVKSIKRPAIFQTHPPTASSLKSRIEEEEQKYLGTIQGREALIKKWGPTAEDITPYVHSNLTKYLADIRQRFPRNGALYTLCMFIYSTLSLPCPNAQVYC